MGLNLSCGCLKKQPEPQPRVIVQEKNEPNYQQLANRNTSYIHAKFDINDRHRNYCRPELVLSGLPDDMHREYLKITSDTAAYLATRYPDCTLLQVEYIHLYNSPDAIFSFQVPFYPSPMVPVVIPAANVHEAQNVKVDQ